MAKFRKKPVVVEAEQYRLNRAGTLPPGVHPANVQEETYQPYVITAHGQRTPVVEGDWIIAEPDGRGYYPCKPDIFAATYEAMEDREAVTILLVYVTENALYQFKML